MFLAVTLGGCSPFYVDWDRRTIRTAPEVISPAAAPAPIATRPEAVAPQRQNLLVRPRKHKPRTAPSDTKEVIVEPETTQDSLAPMATPTISISEPGGTNRAAEKEIAATSQRLASFDRNRLSGPSLATYDAANGLLNQGKQALAEKDYVAASGFAQKASVLAEKLQAVTAR